MKIIVLNGSPKGDISVTMQYVHFTQKKFPQHELKILNISLALIASLLCLGLAGSKSNSRRNCEK